MIKSIFSLINSNKEEKRENSPYLVVGLGNPEERYDKTRHNIGFMSIDKIKETYRFQDFQFSKKMNAEISKGLINNNEVFLVKPSTFMNLSGGPVSKIIRFYKIKSEKIIIIHDDIDIPIEKIKIVKNKGAGGHRGVASIIKEKGDKDFIRIRVGVAPEKKPDNASNFVLGRFREEEPVKDIIEKTSKIVFEIIKKGIDRAASLFNN